MAGGKSSRLIIFAAAAACAGLLPTRVEGGAMKADWVLTYEPKEESDPETTAAPKRLSLHPEFTFDPIDFSAIPQDIPLSDRSLNLQPPRLTFAALAPWAGTRGSLPPPGITGVDLTLMTGHAPITPNGFSSPVAAATLPDPSHPRGALSPSAIASVVPAVPLSFDYLEDPDPAARPSVVRPDAASASQHLASDAPSEFAAVALRPGSFPFISGAGKVFNPEDHASPDEDSGTPLAAGVGVGPVETVSRESQAEAARMPMGLVSYTALNDIESRVMRRIAGRRGKPLVANPAKSSSLPPGISALDGRDSGRTGSGRASAVGSTEWLSQFNGVVVDTPAGPRSLTATDPRLQAPPDPKVLEPTHLIPEKNDAGMPIQLNIHWSPSRGWTDSDGLPEDPADDPNAPEAAADPAETGAVVNNADSSAAGSYGGGGGGGGFSVNAAPVLPSPVAGLAVSRDGGLASAAGWMAPAASAIRPDAVSPAASKLATAAQAPVAAPSPAVSRSSSAASPASANAASASAHPSAATYTYIDLHPTSWDSSQVPGVDAGRAGGSVTKNSTGVTHAATWSGGQFADMHPTSAAFSAFSNSQVSAVSGKRAVGTVSTGNASAFHATLWADANPINAIDLNTSAYSSTYAQAISGTQIAGYGEANSSSPFHALVWNGSPAAGFTVIDLNPSGGAYTFMYSSAYGTDGIHQVGGGLRNFGNNLFRSDALAWGGTAASAVDIHPTKFALNDSNAVTVAGSRAGGSGASPAGPLHAILWTALSGDSAVDVTPALFTSANVTSVNANAAVGVGTLANDPRDPGGVNGYTHALAWNIDGSSYTDLSTFLAPKYVSSEADGIDAGGNIVGFATDASGNEHAVQWTVAVPEPASLAMLVGVFALAGRRSRRRV